MFQEMDMDAEEMYDEMIRQNRQQNEDDLLPGIISPRRSQHDRDNSLSPPRTSPKVLNTLHCRFFFCVCVIKTKGPLACL